MPHRIHPHHCHYKHLDELAAVVEQLMGEFRVLLNSSQLLRARDGDAPVREHLEHLEY